MWHFLPKTEDADESDLSEGCRFTSSRMEHGNRGAHPAKRADAGCLARPAASLPLIVDRVHGRPGTDGLHARDAGGRNGRPGDPIFRLLLVCPARRLTPTLLPTGGQTDMGKTTKKAKKRHCEGAPTGWQPRRQMLEGSSRAEERGDPSDDADRPAGRDPLVVPVDGAGGWNDAQLRASLPLAQRSIP